MKTIAIYLRLETDANRKRMMGIFRRIGTTEQYGIRIIPSEEALLGLLTSANGAERPDGLISRYPYSEDTRRAMGATDIPLVGVGMSDDELGVRPSRAGFILNDNKSIGRAAAEFFLNHGGYRSFAYVPDERGRTWSKLREKSFAAALSRAGKRCRVFGQNGTDTASLGEFLAKLPRPAALLAAWDGQAVEVIRAANKANLKIPEDLAILGVDDDALICEHAVPPLSSIRTNTEGMGERAAQILLDLLKNPLRKNPRVVCCPILGITERGTTGTPAPAASLVDRAMAFINAKATEGIKPDDIARHLGISRRLLDLRFRQLEKRSVTEVITERKIQSACKLLARSATPVKNVFRQSGFGDISYATKLFREKTGLTPKAWRVQQAE